MGLERINQVLEALREAGFRVRRGFVSDKIPCLTDISAVVSLYEDASKGVTVVTTIYAPAKMGGIACEDAGIRALAALRQLGADCTLQWCSFESTTGVFSMELLALFAAEAAQ